MSRSGATMGGLVIAMGGLLALTACSDGSGVSSQGPPAASAAVTAPAAVTSTADEVAADEPVVTGDATTTAAGVDLDFTATTLDGATFEGTSLAGEPALLWFWAPWCPTCAGQADHVSEVADAYAGEMNVVGVGGLDQAAAMRGFVSDRDVDNFVHLSDETGIVWQRFGITAQSTYVVLDANGVVVSEGVLSDDELDRAVTAAVAGNRTG